MSRRQEYAENTRRAIVTAARQLFAERGYFATKVDDIADLARVAPATVYAVSGGKHGLLRTLTETASSNPIVEAAIARIEELDDPAEIIRVVSATASRMREEFGDIMRLLFNTAPHDECASDNFAIAKRRYREAFAPVVQRLIQLDALREDLDLKQAIDVCWFYFGSRGVFILREENGWSYERAEQWLCSEASRALLRDGVRFRPGA